MKTLKDYGLTLDQVKEIMLTKGVKEITSIECGVWCYSDGSCSADTYKVVVNGAYDVYVIGGGNVCTTGAGMRYYAPRVSARKTTYTKKRIKENNIKFEKVSA